MAKINLDQYPELKKQADYILKIEGLAEKISNKIKLLKGMKGKNDLDEMNRTISIDKNELELQAIEREIDEKKKKYAHLTGLLKDALKDMESNYDKLYEKAKETEQGRAIIDSVDLTYDENKLDLFLKLRDYERSKK
jgi:predicted  nucleic acid-binding Zn-ribbon protein